MTGVPFQSSCLCHPSPEAGSGSGERPVVAVILAAGRSKRMQSDLVKVLHEVAGRPMIDWVIDACRDAGCEAIHLVIGHQGEQVKEVLGSDPAVHFVTQSEQLGTGHAVLQAKDALAGFTGDVVILAGDGPLIRTETIEKLIETHRTTGAAATLATSVIDDPTGYGRILRNDAGRLLAIIEEKDATPEEREICEINPSYYCVKSENLWDTLEQVGTNNASGEIYVTDIFEILHRAGKTVEVIDAVDPNDVLSVNTPEQLAEVDEILSRRLSQEATP